MADEELKTEAQEVVVPPADDAAEEQASGGDTPAQDDEGIKNLKRQLEMERQARAEAERRAREAQNTASRASLEVQDSNLQLIVSAIDSVRRSSEMMKRDYAMAMSAGDYEAAAEIQSNMSLNSAKLLQLENGKSALEQRLANPPKQQPEPPADPVEAIASQLSPRSAAWVRAHPECVKDRRLYMKMIGAHNIAVADGFEADTDDYFAEIERQMGYRKPQTTVQADYDDEPTSAAAKPMAKKPPPPAAPSSRTASNGTGRNTVTLTSQEREMASIMGMTPEEYAKNKVALKKEGKIN